MSQLFSNILLQGDRIDCSVHNQFQPSNSLHSGVRLEVCVNYFFLTLCLCNENSFINYIEKITLDRTSGPMPRKKLFLINRKLSTAVTARVVFFPLPLQDILLCTRGPTQFGLCLLVHAFIWASDKSKTWYRRQKLI